MGFVIGYFIRQKYCEYELKRKIENFYDVPIYDPEASVWYSYSVICTSMKGENNMFTDKPMIVWHIMSSPKREEATIYDSLAEWESYREAVKKFKELLKQHTNEKTSL